MMRQNVRFTKGPKRRVLARTNSITDRPAAMRTMRSPTRFMLPDGIARLVAVVAMLMQVLVATAHMGGEVARAAEGEPFLGLDFLEICTGHGIEIIGPSSSGQGTSGTAACAVCTSACVFGFDQPATGADVADVSFDLIDLETPKFVSLTERIRFLTDGPIRAPPTLRV